MNSIKVTPLMADMPDPSSFKIWQVAWSAVEVVFEENEAIKPAETSPCSSGEMLLALVIGRGC